METASTLETLQLLATPLTLPQDEKKTRGKKKTPIQQQFLDALFAFPSRPGKKKNKQPPMGAENRVLKKTHFCEVPPLKNCSVISRGSAVWAGSSPNVTATAAGGLMPNHLSCVQVFFFLLGTVSVLLTCGIHRNFAYPTPACQGWQNPAELGLRLLWSQIVLSFATNPGSEQQRWKKTGRYQGCPTVTQMTTPGAGTARRWHGRPNFRWKRRGKDGPWVPRV